VPALTGDQVHDVVDALIDGEPEGEPHHGHVVEAGDHASLISGNGRYALLAA
jgi:hypothetical protein